jgi:hypothetical protein
MLECWRCCRSPTPPDSLCVFYYYSTHPLYLSQHLGSQAHRAIPLLPIPQPLPAWSIMNLQFDPAHGDTPALFPRHGHTLPAIASADGDLFLFGGTFRGEPRSDLYLFSTRDRSATLLQTSGDKPSNTVGYASVLVGGIMVVWGGKSFASGRPDNTVYLLEIGMCQRAFVRLSVNLSSHKAKIPANGRVLQCGGLPPQVVVATQLQQSRLNSTCSEDWLVGNMRTIYG